MNFASDNAGPVHPKVMEALVRANDGYAMPYGNDPLTARAIEKVRDVFEAPDAAVFLVATGTAANSLCLASYSRPWDTVFCARFAHTHVDECNAPEFFAGGIKITTVGKEDDKFTADELEVAIGQWDPANIQNPAHGPVSITPSNRTRNALFARRNACHFACRQIAWAGDAPRWRALRQCRRRA